MAKIPGVVNNVIVRANGDKKLLGIASLALPEVVQKTETISVMGMLGEVEIPLVGHLENMTATIKFSNISSELEVFFESGVDIVASASLQELDQQTSLPTTTPLEAVIKGMPKSVKLGDLAAAAKAESDIELIVTYFKLSIGGKEIVEADKTNFIFNINGKDMLKNIRSDLKM
ncbi:MAG: phage major tail tube protein [Cetobacterium sp.]